ncbi:hypothetical protein PIB30_044471 [Stylosanthes scabra]|uniref:Uncharacterized protein n=1 Tax=Stylosanthes scabra TaxID=79078 RepID=A0ABU6VHA7_9FABA|nr:hypothetical protein [Stylosanthes scabra]
MQQQCLAAWFNSISTRDSDGARFDDTTTFKVVNLKTHYMDQPQMSNSSNAAFSSSKLDMEELVEDVVSEDVVLEEPKMQTVSQGILGCEESDNQEEQKKHLRKEENETRVTISMVQQEKTRGNTRTKAMCKIAQPHPYCCPNIALSVLQVGRAIHHHYLAAESAGSSWKICSSLFVNDWFSWRQWNYIKGAFSQEKK